MPFVALGSWALIAGFETEGGFSPILSLILAKNGTFLALLGNL